MIDLLTEREGILISIIKHFIRQADSSTLKQIIPGSAILTPYEDINDKIENYVEWEFKKRRKGR